MVRIKHTPYKGGIGTIRLGLKPIEESKWLEFDDNFKKEQNLKENLLKTKKNQVLKCSISSYQAQLELQEILIKHLKRYHANQYTFLDDSILVLETKKELPINKSYSNPIEKLSLLVQEDLILMMPKKNNFYLEAASLCSPSHWSLIDKFSHSLKDLHSDVPGYEAEIGKSVDNFFLKIPEQKIFERKNWSIYDSPELFQPQIKEKVRFKAIDIENLGNKLFLRVERQTLRKLPYTGAILFTIRVHVDPLSALEERNNLKKDLYLAIQNLTPEMKKYKSLNQFENIILKWLSKDL